MAERIGHESQLAPLVRRDGALQMLSSRYGRLNRRFDFIDDKIKTDGRPMPFVTPTLQGGRRNRRPRWFDEQIDGGRTAKHLHPQRSEATADLQPERRAVKACGLFEIINVEIYD